MDNLGDLKFFPLSEYGIEGFPSPCIPDNCMVPPGTCTHQDTLVAAMKVQHDSECQHDELTAIAKQHDQNQRKTTGIQHILPDSSQNMAPKPTHTDPEGEREHVSEIERLRRENNQLRADLRQFEDQQGKLDLLTQKMASLAMNIQALKSSIGQPVLAANATHSAATNTHNFLKSESHPESESRLNCLEVRVEYLEKEVAKFYQMQLQLEVALASASNGSYIWHITDIAQKRSEAMSGQIKSIYSPPFYTGPNGYKMCLCACLNGDGEGYTTHLSVFFILMKGKYDALLQWPFDHKVSLILIDQIGHRHIVKTMIPDFKKGFQQPHSDMNVALRYPQFADISVFENKNYSKGNAIFLKCIVDTSRIHHP